MWRVSRNLDVTGAACQVWAGLQDLVVRQRLEGRGDWEVLHGDDVGGGGRAGHNLRYLGGAGGRAGGAAHTVAGHGVTRAPEEAVVVEHLVGQVEPSVEAALLRVVTDRLTFRLRLHLLLQWKANCHDTFPTLGHGS